MGKPNVDTEALWTDLERYCLIPAVAGHEDQAIREFHRDISALANHVSIDALGNVIARFDGSVPDAPTAMVFAHLDQVGMVVQRITPEGFVRIARIGGIPERVLAGAVLNIHTAAHGAVPAVVGTIAHHLTPGEKKYVVPQIDDMYLDLGTNSAEATSALGVKVGDPVAYEPRFERLAGDRVAATSLDDRGGIAALLQVAKYLAKNKPEWNVCLVGTVQEEFNLRGAMVAAQQILPQVAICLDLVAASDTPDISGFSDIQLGAGPVLGTYTFHGRGTLNGLIPSPRLVSMVDAVANKLGISLQRHATVGLLTDNSYVQLVGDGVAAIDIGWPTRYTHTPVETSDVSDLAKLSELTCALLDSLTGPWERGRISV